MIGDRIRARRKQLGLTQEQLAAGRFDRSYISRIEANEVIPPLETLRVLGERLAKPVSYFLGDPDEFTREKVIHDYLRRAARHARRRRYRQAVQDYQVALDLLNRADDSPRLLSVHIDLAHAYACLNQLDAGARHLFTAFSLLSRVPLDRCPPDTLYRLHYTRGRLAYARDEQEVAAEAFRLAAAAATRAVDRVRAQVALAGTLFRTGRYPEALELYAGGLSGGASRAAAGSPAPRLPQGLVAACHHGAGACYCALGRLDLAAYHLERALQLYRGRDPERLLLASHDLGIVLARKGAWNLARRRLRECLRGYLQRGHGEAVASVLVDLAGLELAAGRHRRALTLARIAKGRAKQARRPRLYLSAVEKEAQALAALDPAAARALNGVVRDLRALG